MAFNGPAPTRKHEVAHGNGDKLDCRAENLRWATRVENSADKIAHGTYYVGEQVHRAKVTADDVREMRRLRSQGMIYREIGERYGVCYGAVYDAVRGKNWKHIPLEPG